MSSLTFSLREAPDQRLDLSPLIPQNLAGKTVAEIERIELRTTRVRVTVGDVFRIREAIPLQLSSKAELSVSIASAWA